MRPQLSSNVAWIFSAIDCAASEQQALVTRDAEIVVLAIEMGKLIQKKWAERGIDFADHFAVGERCFDEVELALERPFKWGREWLIEFYDDPEEAGEQYIMWTDQWLKEFQAMKTVIEEYV